MIFLFIIGMVAGALLMLGIYFWCIGRHRRKMESLTKFVIFSIAVLISYVVAEMIVSTVSGASHPDLSTLIGSTFGGELLFCCVIRVFKIRGTGHADIDD